MVVTGRGVCGGEGVGVGGSYVGEPVPQAVRTSPAPSRKDLAPLLSQLRPFLEKTGPRWLPCQRRSAPTVCVCAQCRTCRDIPTKKVVGSPLRSARTSPRRPSVRLPRVPWGSAAARPVTGQEVTQSEPSLTATCREGSSLAAELGGWALMGRWRGLPVNSDRLAGQQPVPICLDRGGKARPIAQKSLFAPAK